MVEVFKTNVKYRDDANRLLGHIRKNFKDYRANFDLDDCDNILRVENRKGLVCSAEIIEMLRDFGFMAEVLPDNVVAAVDRLFQQS